MLLTTDDMSVKKSRERERVDLPVHVGIPSYGSLASARSISYVPVARMCGYIKYCM